MLGPLTDEIARLGRADLREQACRDRQEWIALRAAGAHRRRMPLMRRKRRVEIDATC
jgi:hypothetical protein